VQTILAATACVAAAACVAKPARQAAPAAAIASSAPDPDAAILGDDCLACHTADLVRQQRLTDKQWAKTLDKMRTWGAPTEDASVVALAAQLETIGPRDAGPYHPRVLSVDEAASLFARQPDGIYAGGNAKRGSTLYADQCAPCHADDAKGGEMGVALAGRHILDRASSFAAIVRAGRGRMPGFDAATDTEIADYLAYLRSLSGSM
jgi:mono/diheme cytochrome c family protein